MSWKLTLSDALRKAQLALFGAAEIPNVPGTYHYQEIATKRKRVPGKRLKQIPMVRLRGQDAAPTADEMAAQFPAPKPDRRKKDDGRVSTGSLFELPDQKLGGDQPEASGRSPQGRQVGPSTPPREQADRRPDQRPAGTGGEGLRGEGTDPAGLRLPAAELTPAETQFAARGLKADPFSGNPDDLRLTDEEKIGEGSLKQKLEDNLRALSVLKKLESEGDRKATKEERKVLAKYVGWGAFGQAFHPDWNRVDRWAEEESGGLQNVSKYRLRGILETDTQKAHYKRHQEIKALMTDEEYAAAAHSALNAHFTSPPVIKAMWKAVERLGFKGGRVLEPSAGSGSFFGFQPEGTTQRSKRTAVELDKLTGGLLKNLYPNATVHVKGFQDTHLADNFFDLAISNVPFGNYPVHDPEYQQSGRGWLTKAIHNYFFAKTLDKTRPGGIVAFITSHHTMDAPSAKRFREYLSEQADFLGAVRLPNDAFKETAGTAVTTDIIFLQKKDPEFERLHPRGEGGRFVEKWDATGPMVVPNGNADDEDEEGGVRSVQVNEYFLAHPEMMLGQMGVGSGYGQMSADETGMKSDGRDLEESLNASLATLPENVVTDPTNEAVVKQEEAAIAAPDTLKEGAFKVEDGEVFVNHDGTLVKADLKGKRLERVMAMTKLREDAQKLVSAMYSEASDEDVGMLQAKLNKDYDAFVAEHGYLHEKANTQAFQEDPDAGLLLALENRDREHEAWTKADIFSERTITPGTQAKSADGPIDAMNIVLNERGELDWARMSELLKQEPEDILDELIGADLVFRDPDKLTDPVTNGWVSKDEYLSGAVRRKLALANELVENDPTYRRNVKELKKAQPKDLLPGEIFIRLGSAWIPPQHISDFVDHLLGPVPYKTRRWNAPEKEVEPQVRVNPATGEWSVDVTDDRRGGMQNRQEWGTERVPATKLLDNALNLRQPTVYEKGAGPDGKKKRMVVQDETLAARAKLEKLQEEFQRWVWQNPVRAEELTKLYNEKFNDWRLREYDGSHLTFPGMDTAAKAGLRSHIPHAVWRAVQEGRGLFDHATGSGKTRTMTATAMELRRLGLAKKPMFVVPKPTLSQWDEEIRKVYPGAKVLVVYSKQWDKEKRRELTSRIATGDWDAVVVTHDTFGQIPVSKELVQKWFKEQLNELEEALVEVRAAKDKKTAKEIEKAKARLEVKLKKKLSDIEKQQDDSLNFDEMGVDALFVDECHMFKNLWFTTKQQRMAGLGGTESGRAIDLFVKSQNMLQKNGNRGLYFGTGTPISNTMAEMFTLGRYLDMPTMRAKGIHRFDNWAGTFGQAETTLEAAPEGGYRQRTRFAKFVNMPELIKLYRKFADVRTAQDLRDVLPTPELDGGAAIGVVAEPSEELTNYIKNVIQVRAKKLMTGQVDPRDDNFLKITSDGRKASLDMRLIEPTLPDDPNSKVNRCVANVVSDWEKHKDRKATQMIFLDLSTPKGVSDKDEKDKPESADGADEDTDSAEEKAWAGSVYQDVRNKLLARGIPASEVAFIHDYNTDTKKKQLSEDMNSGKVRVLIGSSSKAGTGLNVQERLYAVHHLDAPWKPSDIEQRNGRLIRQGNKHKEWGIPVREYRYVTKGSFDEFMWQTILKKAAFIAQARSSDMTQRTMEDTDAMVLSAAQIMAHASGNPLVKEKVEVDAEVSKLVNLETAHQRAKYKASQDIPAMRRNVIYAEQMSKDAQAAIVTLGKNKPKKFAVTVEGQQYDNREKAGQALLIEAERLKKLANIPAGESTTKHIGDYAGFAVVAEIYHSPNGNKSGSLLLYHGKKPLRKLLRTFEWGRMSVNLENITPAGIFTSMDSTLRSLPKIKEDWESQAALSKQDIPRLEKLVGQEYEHKDRLRKLLKRSVEIDDLLSDKHAPVADLEEDTEKAIRLYLGYPKLILRKAPSMMLYKGPQATFGRPEEHIAPDPTRGRWRSVQTKKVRSDEHFDKLTPDEHGYHVWAHKRELARGGLAAPGARHALVLHVKHHEQERARLLAPLAVAQRAKQQQYDLKFASLAKAWWSGREPYHYETIGGVRRRVLGARAHGSDSSGIRFSVPRRYGGGGAQWAQLQQDHEQAGDSLEYRVNAAVAEIVATEDPPADLARGKEAVMAKVATQLKIDPEKVRESVHPNLWDRWEHPGVEKGVLFLGLSKGYTPQFRMKAAAAGQQSMFGAPVHLEGGSGSSHKGSHRLAGKRTVQSGSYVPTRQSRGGTRKQLQRMLSEWDSSYSTMPPQAASAKLHAMQEKAEEEGMGKEFSHKLARRAQKVISAAKFPSAQVASKPPVGPASNKADMPNSKQSGEGAAATEPEDKQEKFPGTVVVGNGPESLVLKAVNPPTSKIIGHTQTKKPIYANPQHPSHARFTGDDHYDAHELHEKRMGAAQKLANQLLNNPSKAQYRQALKLRDAAKAGAIYHGKAAGVTGNYGYYNFG